MGAMVSTVNAFVKKNKAALTWSMGVLIASLAFFGAIFWLDISTDLQRHLVLIQRTVRGEVPLAVNANFLFYLLVYALAFFWNKTKLLTISIVFVLGLSVAAKFILTSSYLEKYARRHLPGHGINSTMKFVFSLAMLLTFSLPTFSLFTKDYFYLGQIPMNVWHNSTTIFLMPFAMLLFYRSYEQLENPSKNGILLVTLLVALNLAAKPSFFFVFCMAYPLMLLREFGLGKRFWQNMLPIFAGLILLAGQYYAIYKIGYASGFTEEREVTINILAVWNIYSQNIPLSLLASLLFPLAYLAGYPQELKENRLLQYILLAYLGGLVIYAVFAETNTFLAHGNFFWQTVVCSYLLFTVLLASFLARLVQSGLSTWKNRLILLAFGLHVGSGVIYLIRLFVMQTYY